MKILIGTPIHQVKDYSMERWLKNVARLQKKTPADLFLIDNSSGLDYVETVKGYCQKYGVKNYKIKHLNLDQKLSSGRRINIAQEALRRIAIGKDYDAWFSWECDQIIPTNALDKLIKIMKLGNFMMVVHNSWDRKIPAVFNFDMGCTLITKKCLKLKRITDLWTEDWLETQTLQNGGSFANVHGAICPIYHLRK
ncbi:MAG: hypothetical protein A3B47_03910 [Candidatus Levybacteria bacterium RIFCSPLOWO2_01_FULL_39_24]|nr:MAG: hypothetical protein A2800_03715 [Candidatus Levybacteria bacterium RIFCSPHIGHO2_01_FULL_40_16]OGH46381.1 MAG: hypothetical protein A3B47_03910 [Candidatus Levybacteria bacterium RIFCSPLOWO2_01_FULL_39_24]